MKSALVALIGLVSPIACGSANSQDAAIDPATAESAYIINSNRDALKVAIQNIQNSLSPDEISTFKKITVKIDDSDWDIFGTRAFKNSEGKRQAVVTLGFLYFKNIMDQGFLEAFLLKDNFSDLAPYLQKAIDWTIEVYQANSLGRQMPSPLPRYCAYISERCSIVDADRQAFADALFNIQISSLTVILGHEVGHHILRHLEDRKKTTYQKELEADRFGIKIAVSSGVSPLSAMGGLALFGGIKNDISTQPDLDQHPKIACRMLQLAVASIELARSDPEWVGNAANAEEIRRNQILVRSMRPLAAGCQ